MCHVHLAARQVQIAENAGESLIVGAFARADTLIGIMFLLDAHHGDPFPEEYQANAGHTYQPEHVRGEHLPGVPGATVTSSDKSTRNTVGNPGTGLSCSERVSGKKWGSSRANRTGKKLGRLAAVSYRCGLRRRRALRTVEMMRLRLLAAITLADRCLP